MTTRKNWLLWRLAALLILPALQACSTTSEPQQHATPSLQVTPLPVEVSQINTSKSQPWRQKAQDWLARLTAWSQSEMPK